jgi:anthranilate/para-aminobenzoate synthase component II
MLIIIDNTQKQRKKMFLPKLIDILNKSKNNYKIVPGDTSGLEDFKKIVMNKNNNVKGIIFSGSPIMLNENSNVEDYVCNLYCLKNYDNIPILGICFGCQLINVFFGGNLYDIKEVYCKQMKVFSVNNEDKYQYWSKINGNVKFCCRYLPNYVSTKHLDTLMKVQVDDSKLIFPCVIKHKNKDITGVMFHPEALIKTHQVINDFIIRCS